MSSVVESKLQELLEFAKRNSLAEVVWKEGEIKIAFRRTPTAKAQTARSVVGGEVPTTPPVEEKIFVKSPIVGTFRRAVSKGQPPLMMIGNHIKAGDPLAVVECMKIPTDVVSYCEGEIKEILVEDGQPVEYGQPLFSILPIEKSTTNGAN